MWPAYVRAHANMLEGGDVEQGKPNGKIKDLVFIEGLSQSIGDVLDLVCKRLVQTAEIS